MNKLAKILIFVGLPGFFISTFAFIINACMKQIISLAWVLFGLIILTIAMQIAGVVLYIISNKGKFKEYYNDLRNNKE